jgi:hypothetical protein
MSKAPYTYITTYSTDKGDGTTVYTTALPMTAECVMHLKEMIKKQHDVDVVEFQNINLIGFPNQTGYSQWLSFLLMLTAAMLAAMTTLALS